MTSTPRWIIIARIVGNLLFALVMYAITVPSCVVPEVAGRPEHFWWGGLVPPTVLVGLVTFAIWWRR